MVHRIVTSHRWTLFMTLGVGLLALAVAITFSKSSPASAQGPLTIDKTASATLVHPGNIVTYTLTVNNTGALGATAFLTDVIPFGVNHVLGSETGGATFSAGPPAQVNWSGPVNPGVPVVLTFAVQVVEPGTLGPFPISNSAQVCFGATCAGSNTVIIYSSRLRDIYLPIIFKNWDPDDFWPWNE